MTKCARVARCVAANDGWATARRFLAAMLSIHDRPLQAQDRSQPGHWEGDLIIGAGGQSSIGTLFERTSRKTKLVHLSGDCAAATVTPAIIKSLRTVPSHMRRSLTWDQGTEMAEHDLISHALGMPVYFCDPTSPWQRATNENANGLLRQYFPKETDLSAYTPTDLRRVEREINSRQRKTLGGRTTDEVFNELTAILDPHRCDDR